MQTAADILLAVIVLLLAVGSAFQFLYRYVFNYRLTETSIQVVVVRVVPVMRVRYTEILEIQELTFWQAVMFPLRQLLKFQFTLFLGNRVIGHVVRIQKRGWLIRSIHITPDNVPAFLQQVRQHLLAN